MSRRILLTLSAICLTACQAGSPPADSSADEAAVRAALAGLETTWNAVDLDANAEYVDSDMVSLPPDAPPIVGEAANRRVWDQMLAASEDEWHPRPEQVWVSGDLAVAWGYSTSTDGDMVESQGKNVWVFRRGADGEWRMLLESWSPAE